MRGLECASPRGLSIGTKHMFTQGTLLRNSGFVYWNDEGSIQGIRMSLFPCPAHPLPVPLSPDTRPSLHLVFERLTMFSITQNLAFCPLRTPAFRPFCYKLWVYMTSINERFLARQSFVRRYMVYEHFTCPSLRYFGLGENRKRLGTNDSQSGALTSNRQQSWDQGKRKSAGE